MVNNKGFTLTEVMVVIIVIGILASLSIPYLLGYAREARNDRAKTVLHMIAQGYKNFQNDFPGATVSNINSNITRPASLDSCTITTDNTFTIETLIACSYLPNIDYGKLKYSFYLGGSCCNASSGAVACMKGADGGDFGSNYCAYIDINNKLYD
jgi:prepilin-type N-terminal cleavage/methylation domain-containing protein